MKLCSPLEEDDGFTGDRTQGFISSPDRLPHHVSCTSDALTQQSTQAPKQTSSQTPPNMNVFRSFSQPSPQSNHKDHLFPSQSENYQTERKYSPPSCLANNSPALTFRTSSGSDIHKLHPEDQNLASETTKVRAETSDKATRAPRDLRVTSVEATPGKSKRHVCCWKMCGKRFTCQKELSAHVNDDHVRLECPEVDFQCNWADCPRQGRGFNARYKMLIHIRTHTNEKPHTCVICRKSFSRLENLKIHTRSHTGERPYSCTFPGCTKAYSNSSDRFKHIRTHQEQKPYKCKMPGCRKQYTDPSSLRKHVRTHNRHTPDSSAVALQQSANSNIPRSYLKIEACSPSGNTTDGQNKLHSTPDYELRDYINTVRHHLEKHNLADDSLQTVHAIKNSNIDRHFPNSKKDTEDLNKSVYNDDKKFKTRTCNDVLGTSQLIWLDKSMNSDVDIQKSCPSNSYIDQKTGFIKYETSSSRQSPMSTHLYNCDEQLLKKEDKQEENDLTCVNDDLHQRIKKFQTEFTTRECLSLLPTHDLTDIPSLLLYDHSKKCQETKMSSCLSSSDLAGRRSCVKSPKIEHWKKRKLLISEKELQTSYHASTSPLSNRPQQSRTFPVSLHPMPSSETPLHSAVHSNCSHLLIPTSSAPLINSLSPLHLSHVSPISHCPASLTPTCPQETSRPASALSSSTPLSPPCQTTAPGLYFFHHNQELYYPLFSNWYSPIPSIANSITPQSLYTHNSLNLALSRSPVLPTPTTCHYNSAADHHQLSWNRDYLLPSGSAFSHSEFHLPETNHVWQHPGFDNLPLLMNIEDTSLLTAASVCHFANSLRFMYQDKPLDLPSLYQSHGCRFPLYLGVHR